MVLWRAYLREWRRGGQSARWMGESKTPTLMKLRFQVAEVQKPLIAVKRIVEQGNYANFGPGEKDNFIENRESGSKVMLRRNGRGSYLMDVNFSGGDSTSITVDSGAEESVCPWEWGGAVPSEGIGEEDELQWREYRALRD